QRRGKRLHLRRQCSVPLGIGRQTLQATRDRLEISRQVIQIWPRHRLNETRRQQRFELRVDIRDRDGERRRSLLLQRQTNSAPFLEDQGHDRRQAISDLIQL